MWCAVLCLLTVAMIPTEGSELTTGRRDVNPALGSTPAGVIAWRDGVACGPNALYIFLACHGFEIPYETIRSEVPLTERGCSFADLLRATDRFGFSAAVVKTDLRHLRKQTLPAIVLLDGLDEPFGHFTVVMQIDDSEVRVMDSVSLITTGLDLGTFQRLWTGYSMVQERSAAVRTLIQFGVVACIVFWVFLATKFFVTGRLWKQDQSAV